MRNILSLLLGVFLKRERELIGYSTEQIASNLGISVSLYRMIESGNANLHPSYAVLLIRTFVRTNLNFDSVAKYLVGIQAIECSSAKFDLNKYKNKIQSLCEVDDQFDKFFRKIEFLWSSDQDNADIREYLSNEEVHEIVESFFSSNKVLPENIIGSKIYSLIETTPSFYLEFIEDFLKNFNKLPQKIHRKELWKWEEGKKDKYVSCYCLMDDFTDLTAIKNLSRYSFSFLTDPVFKSINYIFIEEHHSANEIKKIFLENFKGAREQNLDSNQLKKLSSSFSKIKIKTCKKAFQKAIEALYYDEDINTRATKYDAVWVFKSVDSIFGLMANIDDEEKILIEGTSLRFSESFEKYNTLENLWNEL